jgi:hypothetical protein
MFEKPPTEDENKPLPDDESTQEQIDTQEAEAVEETGMETRESKIDFWEMKQILHELGFTYIGDRPVITDHPSWEHMRTQDMMVGYDIDEKIMTVWRDGQCFAKECRYNIETLEEALGGRILRKGALQPRGTELKAILNHNK